MAAANSGHRGSAFAYRTASAWAKCLASCFAMCPECRRSTRSEDCWCNGLCSAAIVHRAANSATTSRNGVSKRRLGSSQCLRSYGQTRPIHRLADCTRKPMAASLYCDAHGRTRDPGCANLDAGRSLRRVRRHSEIHLIAVYGAGETNNGQNFRRRSVHCDLYRRVHRSQWGGRERIARPDVSGPARVHSQKRTRSPRGQRPSSR